MDVDKPWSSLAPLPQVPGLPDYGWRVCLNHKFTEKCRPFTLPRWFQLPGLLGLSARYLWHWIQTYRSGKKMFIDNLDLCPWRPIYGAPIGGIGCGTIGRGFCGEFCRFQMIPGMYKYHIVEANQFLVTIRRDGQTVYQQVLSPHGAPRSGQLGAWRWRFPAAQAHYHALYPRAWSRYEIPDLGVTLICRQISPVIPHDYKDSSLPAAVFVWEVQNASRDELDVSVTFTFKNGQGAPEDALGGVWSSAFSHKTSARGRQRVSGVMIHQEFNDLPCTYAIAAKDKKSVHVSHCVSFNPNGSGQEIWDDLWEDGRLDCTEIQSAETVRGEELAAAVCAQCAVKPGKSGSVEFSLSWDMPNIHFGSKQTKYCRRYCRWFGNAGDTSPKLASYALNNYPDWEAKIEEWQNPILTAKSLPSWYKSALFNELYFVSDGGTVWLDPVSQPVRNGFKRPHGADGADWHPHVLEWGKFAYLEGQEYRMYNTYDVHHYASFALLMLWPNLQLSIQYDIASAVRKQQPKRMKYLMDGHVLPSKVGDTTPHDIGDPDDEPWERINAYLIHPTQEWKDLNTKFALQVYRDYTHTRDSSFLEDVYPSVKAVMEYSLKWDTDGDGIIDNGGFADQTYDAWSMKGASAYCGGLWVAALKAFVEMATLMKDADAAQRFSVLLTRAARNYDSKLWNGSYYNFDSSSSSHHDSVMSDQLAGHWFLKASHVPDSAVFQKDRVRRALQAIHAGCVLPFDGGRMGAINGMRPDGRKDTSSPQSEEFWTGVTYSLGSLMLMEDLEEEAWQTAYGAYHVCWERYGLAFQSPEAYMDDRRYRSLGYMRPLAIWGIQHAIENFRPELLEPGE